MGDGRAKGTGAPRPRVSDAHNVLRHVEVGMYSAFSHRPPERESACRAEAMNAPAVDGPMTAVRRRRDSRAQLEAYFNAAPELLGAIVDVLDVRTAFPRLSGIIQENPAPHDAPAIVVRRRWTADRSGGDRRFP